MTRIQTYYLIGNILSINHSAERREAVIKLLQTPTINWSRLIATASNHLVLQTLYSKIVEYKLSAYIPAEVLEHLQFIYNLNYKRNTEIVNQVKYINLLLGSNGIVPLYLKGIGNIIDGVYNDIGERIMYDIDFLVPDNQFEASVEILLKDGFFAKKAYNPSKRARTKHYPPLSKSGFRTSIEIHRLPVDYEFTSTFETKEIWENKKLVENGFNCYVMSDKHKIIHNFIHSQLHHKGHLYAKVFLRNLYDLFLLSKRANPELVFAGINKYNKQAASYLAITNKAFGGDYLENNALNYLGSIFLLRHEINLRTWVFSRFSFLTIKIYRGYIKLPLQSFNNKELRASLIKRLLNRDWYAQHLHSYKRI